MPYAGGIAYVELEVEPYDGTTTVTVEVHGPDGTALTPTPTSTDGGKTWLAWFVPTVAGKWVVDWTVTGTGEGPPTQDVWVAAAPSAASAVAWRPLLEDVAAYVPDRTRVGAIDGYGNPIHTFDGQTHPPASTVQRLITDACAWVLAGVGDLDSSLAPAATGLAARRTAGWLEYSYFDNERDKQHAERLLKEAADELAALAKRNEGLTGDDPSTSADEVLPQFYFPAVCETWPF